MWVYQKVYSNLSSLTCPSAHFSRLSIYFNQVQSWPPQPDMFKEWVCFIRLQFGCSGTFTNLAGNSWKDTRFQDIHIEKRCIPRFIGLFCQSSNHDIGCWMLSSSKALAGDISILELARMTFTWFAQTYCICLYIYIKNKNKNTWVSIVKFSLQLDHWIH